MKLSARIQSLTSSPIRKLSPYADAAKAAGKKVYHLNIGQPDIKTPEQFMNSIRAYDAPVIAYSNSKGEMFLLKAIEKYYNEKGMDYTTDDIFVTNGGSEALIMAIMALCDPDDEIMVFEPFYANYTTFCKEFGAKINAVPTSVTDGYHLPSEEEIEKHITAKTKAILLTNPGNPTGVVYSEETIKELAAILEKKQQEFGSVIYLISDEPYRELAYDGVEVPYLTKYYKNTVVGYSYSKSLSLPGERIGYVIVPDEVTESKTVYAAIAGAGRALGYVCAPSMFQKVIASCVGNTGDIELYRKNRDLLYDGLTKIGYECFKPQGAFYMFVKALEPDADAFCERAKDQDLLIVSATGFGCPGYARVAYCVDYDMIERSFSAFEKLYQSYRKEI